MYNNKMAGDVRDTSTRLTLNAKPFYIGFLFHIFISVKGYTVQIFNIVLFYTV
jgi:hypothetical protein